MAARRFSPPAPPYLGPAKFHGGSQAAAPLKRIVIHGTVSPCKRGGARDIAAYFRSTVTRPSSAHYVVDPGEVVQVVGDHQVAYHAPPNEDSIGVELCDPQAGPDSRWRDADHGMMLGRAAELVARLCLAYDVPVRRVGPVGLRLGRRGVTSHVAVSQAWRQTSHTDPGPGFPWPLFMNLVRREVDQLKGTPPPVPAPPIPPLPPTPRPAPLRLTIITANYWRENEHPQADRDLLARTRAHLIGINEGRNWIELLKNTDGYTLVAPGRGAALNNPVLVRDDVAVIGTFAQTMCAAVGPSPERTASVVEYRYGDEKWAHVQTHSNAHIESAGEPRDLPRVKANIEHMKKLRALVLSLRQSGYRVTVGGDFNWAWTPNPKAWLWSPKVVFKGLGMEVQWANGKAPQGGSLGARRVDYLAHSPQDLIIEGQRIVAGEHSDHRWPAVTYRLV